MKTEIIDQLFLELSQITTATTKREKDVIDQLARALEDNREAQAHIERLTAANQQLQEEVDRLGNRSSAYSRGWIDALCGIKREEREETTGTAQQEAYDKGYDMAKAMLIAPAVLLKVRRPHNPDGLTDEQLEADKGYRFLDRSEVVFGGKTAGRLPLLWEISCWVPNKNLPLGGNWQSGYYGDGLACTYRTNLLIPDLYRLRFPRAELK